MYTVRVTDKVIDMKITLWNTGKKKVIIHGLRGKQLLKYGPNVN